MSMKQTSDIPHQDVTYKTDSRHPTSSCHLYNRLQTSHIRLSPMKQTSDIPHQEDVNYETNLRHPTSRRCQL
ncbi:hypothetical protein BgiBS90_028785 [Biomphalaria glabrata]|nr:hypothetical protein BgiBS90_028785 [Biomphalaria glabrata]